MIKIDNKIEIIFEDDAIVVVSKPAGVFTIPDRYDKNALNLAAYLKQKYENIFTVHRLDRDTSGVIVFAKNAESHKHLNTQFQEHSVTKIYHVLVEGTIKQPEIDIDIPITENPSRKGVSMPSARGKQSLSKLKVLERFRTATLCEINLVTGRHHQIRVHCSAIGHPLLVDEIYGNHQNFLLSSIKKKFNLKKDTSENPLLSRISMHSLEIGFIHPLSNTQVNYKCAYPKDFSAVLQVLRKYSKTPDFSIYNI